VLRLELAAQDLQRKAAEAAKKPHARRRTVPVVPGAPVIVTYSAKPMAANLDEAQKTNAAKPDTTTGASKATPRD
jgi:hypothetical protein